MGTAAYGGKGFKERGKGTPHPLCPSNPMSDQHEALVPSSFARWILAVQLFNRSYRVLRVLCDGV